MELFVLAASRGGGYALLAVGFSLVYGVGGVLNLFHGTFFLLGAYAAFFFAQLLHADAGSVASFAIIALSTATVALIAWAWYWVAVRRTAGSQIRTMIVGLAANLVVAQALLWGYGVIGAHVPPVASGVVRIGGTSIAAQEVVTAGVAVVVFVLLSVFLRATRFGRAVRALASDRVGALLVGIRPDRYLAATLAVSGALAALAGALTAPMRIVTPELWAYALLKSFVIVIVGGIGSLRGTLVAAYGLALVEVAGSYTLGEAWAETLTMLAAIVALLLRPRGIVDEQPT